MSTGIRQERIVSRPAVRVPADEGRILAQAGVARADLERQRARVEDSEKENRREQIELVLMEMDDLELEPVRMIQGSETVDWVEMHKTGAASRRPFIVFEVRFRGDPSHRSIYKSEIASDAKPEGFGIDKEVAFYQHLLHLVRERLPDGIRDEIVFPEFEAVYATETGRAKGIQLSYLDGQVLGTAERSFPQVAQERDLDRIVALIQAAQSIPPDLLLQMAPHTKEKEMIGLQEEAWRANWPELAPFFGEDADALEIQARALLDKAASAQIDLPPAVLSEDVYQTNLIKLTDGRLGSIDWERPLVGIHPNLGKDYAKVISRMWSEPEAQASLIQKTLKANEHVPGFGAMLRSFLLVAESAHLAKKYARWIKTVKTDPTAFSAELIAEAQAGLPAVVQNLRELIEGNGPWA